jgi:hypothetical protein
MKEYDADGQDMFDDPDHIKPLADSALHVDTSAAANHRDSISRYLAIGSSLAGKIKKPAGNARQRALW